MSRRDWDEFDETIKPQQLRRCTFRVPICDICLKEVDKFEQVKGNQIGVIKLVAHCHGDTSESPWLDVNKMDSFYTFRAFLDPKRQGRQGRVLKHVDHREIGGYKWLKRS